MSIDKKQFKTLISTTLQVLDLHSKDAVCLLLGTAAQESKFGHYIEQLGSGPAKGFFQIEPATELDNWVNYLRYRPELARQIVGVSGLLQPTTTGLKWLEKLNLNRFNVAATHARINPNALGNNLIYDICMARIKYRRSPGNIPSRHDLPAQAAYWKKYYNTAGGHGTVGDYIQNYKKHVK